MHKGIDVSTYQGYPDFQKVKEAGHRFVYIKATEGLNSTNPGYQRRQRDARHANLHTGFYHFLRPQIGRTGFAEAEHFYRTVQGIERGQERGAKLLRLALDVEATTLTPAQTLLYVRQCVERLKELCDHRPMIYTTPSFLPHWGETLGSYPLWLAHFTTAARPTLPKGFTHWTIWQHSKNGSCPGVGGPVDLDRCPLLAPILLDRKVY